MTEDWRNSIDNKEAVAAVAVDLSKAFDAINHRLLLAKLKVYGLMNDFPVIGYPGFAHRILGSPGGKHCLWT